MTSSNLLKYFPLLSEHQIQQFNKLPELYHSWNDQINVISRKDIDQLMERHVLHSLGIARVISFLPGEKILDVGTGGGFPGIPLAILFPQTDFFLVDSIGKKIKVVTEIATALGLNNLKAAHQRAEGVKDKFDFVVSRAVTRLNEFNPWVKDKFNKQSKNTLPNGTLCLKGGNLSEEIKESGLVVKQFYLKDYFKEDFFETKQVVYIEA